MRSDLRSPVAVLLLLTLGPACSGGSAGRREFESTATRSARPDPSNRSTPELRASASNAPEYRGPSACPMRAPRSVPHHQRAGTARTFVPGHPITLLACRYHGFNQPQPIGTFARSAAGLPASSVAHELNATPRPTTSVVPYCPNDSGETYMLYFSYRGGRPLLARVDSGGCRYVTNGDLSRPFPPVELSLRLEAALGRDVEHFEDEQRSAATSRAPPAGVIDAPWPGGRDRSLAATSRTELPLHRDGSQTPAVVLEWPPSSIREGALGEPRISEPCIQLGHRRKAN